MFFDYSSKTYKVRKISFLFCLIVLILVSSGFGQKRLRKHKNEAFKPGEVLKFRVHYGFIDAGEAIMEIKDKMEKIGNRNCYHIIGIGYSVGAFNFFYKVKDRYETYLDAESLVPWLFIRRVNEGGYIINENVSFNPTKNTATSEKGTFTVPPNIQDMLSTFYYARTLDYTNAQIGQVYPIEAFIDNEVVPMNIKYAGKETIKNRLGTFRCIKFKPLLQTGRVFKEKEEMTVWISDDKNRIPIRLETKVIVGSIKMDLVDYSGLAHPLAKVEE